MTKLEGGCLCGDVRYSCDADVELAGNCYCANCRRGSGTGHASNFAVNEGALSVTGKVSAFTSDADSGSAVTRYFCPRCGVRLYSTTTGFPGMCMLAAGTLDDPELFKPVLNVYVSRAPSWDRPPEGLPAFDEMPPRE